MMDDLRIPTLDRDENIVVACRSLGEFVHIYPSAYHVVTPGLGWQCPGCLEHPSEDRPTSGLCDSCMPIDYNADNAEGGV